jgi:cytochrome c peroxidase
MQFVLASCHFCHTGPELTRSSFSFVAATGPIDTVITGGPDVFQTPSADTGFLNTGVRPASEDPGLRADDDFGNPISVAERTSSGPFAVSGAFQIPGLRNVELTGPYFHNGGQATLEQVVEFYTRGGDFLVPPAFPSRWTPGLYASPKVSAMRS